MGPVPQFLITDEHIRSFRRWVKKPRDCVINALEIIGIVDSAQADIMRIMVGDTGVLRNQIEEIFEYNFPEYTWRFRKYKDLESIAKFCVDTLETNHVVFCGYSVHSSKINEHGFQYHEDRHVFLIGKSSDGRIVYIDPQINTMCDLTDPRCLRLIDMAQRYYMLQTTADAMQTQDIRLLRAFGKD